MLHHVRPFPFQTSRPNWRLWQTSLISQHIIGLMLILKRIYIVQLHMYLCDITNIQISRFNTFTKSFKKLDFPSVSCWTYWAKCFVPDCSMCLHDQAQQVLEGLHKCISSSPTTAIVKLSFKTGSKLYIALAWPYLLNTVLGATNKLFRPNARDPQGHDSTPRRLSSVYPRQATHVLLTKKMDPSSPNADSIMWTHTSLEINIKFKIK